MDKQQKENEVWGQWITIDNYRNYPALINTLADFAGDNILGFVYIDHVAGTTLEVVKLFNNVDGKIEFTDSPLEKEIRVIIRYAQFSQTHFQVIHDRFLGDFEFTKPSYIESYNRNDLTEFRNNEAFDIYRAEGFPDDVQIILFANADVDDKFEPELVWGRVEKYSNADKLGFYNLLVQPHQNLGINKNEKLPFKLMNVDDKIRIVSIATLIETKKESKPWWKIW